MSEFSRFFWQQIRILWVILHIYAKNCYRDIFFNLMHTKKALCVMIKINVFIITEFEFEINDHMYYEHLLGPWFYLFWLAVWAVECRVSRFILTMSWGHPILSFFPFSAQKRLLSLSLFSTWLLIVLWFSSFINHKI